MPSSRPSSFVQPAARHAMLAAGCSLALLTACSPTVAEPVTPEIETVEERATSFAVRGWGSVYLMPDPGKLEIVVEKQDLNRLAGADILTARLLGPDRREIAVAHFPDDGNADAGGGAGPIQRAVFVAEVTDPGLYKLDLEARTGQEPGHDLVWGVSTNSPKVAIESLLSFMVPDREGNIYFLPPERDFELGIRGIGSQQTIRLFDHRGELAETFDTRTQPAFSKRASAPANSLHEPWRIHLEQQRASIQISTQNDGAEGHYPNFEYWAPDPDLLFPVEEVRWITTPHQTAIHPEGEAVRLPFTLYNGGADPGIFSLALDAPPSFKANLVGENSLALAAGESREVWIEIEAHDLSDKAEESIRLIAVREDSPGVTGYSTIRLRGGPAPTGDTLTMPVQLQPYRHENLQFGYAPDYVPNVPYFDRDNRPFIRSRSAHRHHSPGLNILADNGWRDADYMEAIQQRVPDLDHTWFASYRLANKVGFDADGDAYTLLSVTRRNQPVTQRQALLLHTPDQGGHFEAHPIGEIGDATFELEQFAGHNDDTRPPALLLYSRVADHPARWAWLNELTLFLPEKDTNETLSLGEGIIVSERALNPAAHSGGGSPLATRGDLTFIVWGEAVDPDGDAPGVPSYISVYDRASNNLEEKQFLAHAPPINDSHNSPAIVLDNEGYIHVVVGAHGRPFQYLRSNEPLRIDAGFTDPVDILSTGRIQIGTDIPERGAQTYVGLVATPDDTLHVVSRQWREGVDDYHDGHLYAALSYQRKRPDEDWEEPVVLVVPPLPNYSVYYHKLSIDRLGRLYLAYSYYSTHEHYRNDLPGLLNYQAVLMSDDGGDNWKLATTEDFLEGIQL